MGKIQLEIGRRKKIWKQERMRWRKIEITQAKLFDWIERDKMKERKRWIKREMK